jgi:hypothetical protein
MPIYTGKLNSMFRYLWVQYSILLLLHLKMLRNNHLQFPGEKSIDLSVSK